MLMVELEKCVELGFLPFTAKDVSNMLQSFKKLDPEDENIDFLRMCQSIKEKDPNFMFEFMLDANDKLENIACHTSLSSSIRETCAYEIPTHKITAYDIPKQDIKPIRHRGILIGEARWFVPCFGAGE
ncbi:hypothetical protein ISN44_As06g009530 [Arabidopsis suecica]|uniref:FAR1-related sequence 11-like HTH-like domain-containing protein n=2 Tax=Arabidopsis TaxID=3701 RepID=A0A178WEQ5_ARATH|nr:hypothetical protein ISN44_As06g009530 [Arabidopsis suecica]OAP16716.1 hypothetical protein AXX17_AT1G10170 [Arabidopsis thaliana]